MELCCSLDCSRTQVLQSSLASRSALARFGPSTLYTPRPKPHGSLRDHPTPESSSYFRRIWDWDSVEDMKDQKRSRNPVRPPPDDVLMDILSRLPADDLLKFRRVCRAWNALISTQHFAKIHLKSKHSSSPMILLQERQKELLLLDKWKPQQNIQRSNDFIVFNPVIGEKVTILAKSLLNFCGVFFNPLLKEYSCMFLEPFKLQFSMLKLGAQPCYRDLKYPFPFIHVAGKADPPVVIDDVTLYWLVGYEKSIQGGKAAEFPSCKGLILGFDTKTEEFSVMPHPDPTNDSHHLYHFYHMRNMHIHKMDDHLSFVQFYSALSESSIINIWTLKDSSTRLWTKSKSVTISSDHFDGLYIRVCHYIFERTAAGNGELLLWLPEPEDIIFACNLELGTIRRIGWKCRLYCMFSYVSVQ